MKIEHFSTRQEAIEFAAELFVAKANASPTKPVGLATGSTMEGVYQELNAKQYLPRCASAFALDEYLGLPEGHENSYFLELTEKFSKRLGWTGELHVPGNGQYTGPAGPEMFEKSISELGPISVQLLGFGTNGHIAFNEPGAAFDSKTREVELHPQTRLDNVRFFSPPESMPTGAMTQGLGTIRRATSLLLIVLGERKRPALEQALNSPGPLTPLAALLEHTDLTLVTDLVIG